MAASQNSLQHRVPYYHAFPVCQFSKFPPHGLREYVRIRPAVRINLASKNRTVIPAKRRLHKIPKHHTTETRRPVRETFRQRIDLAGLLTDPCPEAFPIPAGQWLRYSERHGASQQRDCPGFAPDSLFTPSRGRGAENQIWSKYSGLFRKIVRKSGLFSQTGTTAR